MVVFFPCLALPMGNIREGYDKVFNGQRFKDFRDIIRKEGLVERVVIVVVG